MVKAVVISMKHDRERRARIERSMPKSLDWSFIDAVNGHRPANIEEKYHALCPKRFWGSSQLKPGAFGCFASHVKAWEICVDADHPLIVLEDDVVFSQSGPGLLQTCKSIASDLVFLNKRVGNWYRFFRAYKAWSLIPSRAIRERIATRATWQERDDAGSEGLVTHPLQPIVSGIVESNMIPTNHQAAGSDCYFISPDGAKKLLRLSAKYGAVVGLDWFIVASAMLGKPPRSDRRWKVPAQALSYFDETVPIHAEVAECCVADSVDEEVGGSAIKHDVVMDTDEYQRSLKGRQ